MPPAVATTDAAIRQITLQATAYAWVEVRQKTGRVLLRRTLKPGETWLVPADPGLLLSTGNAGGLELVVDGVPSRLTGTKGGKVRDMPLDSDLIRSGTARATP